MPRHMFFTKIIHEGGPRGRQYFVFLSPFYLALVSFICYYLLCQISNFKCIRFYFYLSFFFTPLVFTRQTLKTQAAWFWDWVTQSAACQAMGHKATWQLIWQVPQPPIRFFFVFLFCFSSTQTDSQLN